MPMQRRGADVADALTPSAARTRIVLLLVNPTTPERVRRWLRGVCIDERHEVCVRACPDILRAAERMMRREAAGKGRCAS
jgi:hypothetical protein